MIPPSEAVASQSASISIASSPEAVFDLVSDLPRMGEWSPESIGGEWIDGATGKAGDWFRGHNRSGEFEWTRESEVVVAERGREFTFVVGGKEANRTWWSYEIEPGTDGETVLTERWWIVNLSPALADMTPQQLQARVDITLGSIQQTLAAIKASAEA